MKETVNLKLIQWLIEFTHSKKKGIEEINKQIHKEPQRLLTFIRSKKTCNLRLKGNKKENEAGKTSEEIISIILQRSEGSKFINSISVRLK